MDNLSQRFFAWLFPAKCIVCKKEGPFICQRDLRCIPLAAKPDKDWIISVWNYKDPKIKKLLWMLKFEHKFAVAQDLSQILFDHLFEELAERAIFENDKISVLVPIPLSKKGLRTRGYNQSEIIAKTLADKSNGKLIVKNILEKTRETLTQHSINNRNERLKNLRGVFTVKENYELEGKNVILVDDITTTHGTLIEAKRALKDAGARSVIGFTVAH